MLSFAEKYTPCFDFIAHIPFYRIISYTQKGTLFICPGQFVEVETVPNQTCHASYHEVTEKYCVVHLFLNADKLTGNVLPN